MLNKVAIYLINFYQKYISPYKGYCCAYRVYHNDISCSEFAKNSFNNLRFFHAISNIKQRFKECKISAQNLKQEQECCKSEKFKKFDKCIGCINNGCNAIACLDILGK